MELEEWAEGIPPGIMEELRGVAAGAGLSLEAVLAINYAEILGGGEECTAAVVSANLSATGAPIVWKNRDVGSRWVQHQVITVVNDGQGYRFVAVTTAGYWGVAMGVNEKGLAVVNTAITAKYSNPNPRWGNLDLIRLILYNASTVEEAYRLLNSTAGKYSGSSFLIVDPHHAAVIDVVGDHLQVLTYANGSFLVRTNHWVGVAPEELWSYQKYSYSNSSSTVRRYQAAYNALMNLSSDGQISFEDMLEVARNTENGYSYYSPCRFPKHPGAPKEAVKEASTVSAAIITPNPRDPGLSIMWASLGNPYTTLFIPVSVTLSLYTAQSVELRNTSTNDEWMFKLLASAEPWLASEELRMILFEEDQGMAFKEPETLAGIRSLMTSTELAVWNYMSRVEAYLSNNTAVNVEDETKILVNDTETHLAGIMSLLNSSASFNYSLVKTPFLRIYMALYVSLRSDAWGLYVETGDKLWDTVEGMFLDAYYDVRRMIPSQVEDSIHPATRTETVTETLSTTVTETRTVTETLTTSSTITTTSTRTVTSTSYSTATTTATTTMYKTLTRTSTLTSTKTIVRTTTRSLTTRVTETLPTTLTTTVKETNIPYIAVALIVGLIAGAVLMASRKHG